VAVRPWELQLAAGILGISQVTVASYPDGGLGWRPERELSERIGRTAGQHSADLLLIIDPAAGDREEEAADDAAVAAAACAAARRAGLPSWRTPRTPSPAPGRSTWAPTPGPPAPSRKPPRPRTKASHPPCPG
jgi:LmbE family N-acetylglucosaminyl deacetylase